MSQQWYCKVNGREYGPISPSELQAWVQQCRLSPDDQVRKEGGGWVAAKDVKGINWPTAATVQAPPPTPVAEMPEEPWATPSRGVGSPIITHSTPTKLAKSPKNVLAIFDWQFEYYMTPWIIRVLWGAFLLLMVIIFVLNTFGVLWGMLPDMSSTSSARPAFGGGFEGPSESWLPSWLTTRLARVIVYVISIIAQIVFVLITRTMLELMIVVFRIAEDIGFLKRKSAEEGKG